MSKYAYWLIVIIAISSCEENEPISQEHRVGFSYFPLSVGDYRVFKVQTITSTILDDSVITESFLKEEIVDAYQNNSKDSTYILHRSSKELLTSAWEFDSAWSVRRTANQAITVENNIPFVKLSFPLSDQLFWDGNILNTREQDDYEVEYIGIPFEGMDNTFDNAVSVLHENNLDSIIFLDIRKEVFALDVGLVYKEISQISYCSDTDLGCLGLKIIENSYSKKIDILEYNVQ